MQFSWLWVVIDCCWDDTGSTLSVGDSAREDNESKGECCPINGTEGLTFGICDRACEDDEGEGKFFSMSGADVGGTTYIYGNGWITKFGTDGGTSRIEIDNRMDVVTIRVKTKPK